LHHSQTQALAAEAELGALFLNAQEAQVIRLVLNELGHPQPPTPIHINITTTVGILSQQHNQKTMVTSNGKVVFLVTQR
jgi:hypothetical protein